MARGLLKRGHAEPDKFRLRRVYREEFLAVFGGEINVRLCHDPIF
jgi:hypothetical protein